MKAMLEFTLPEQEAEWRRASSAERYYRCIRDVVYALRDARKGEVKHGSASEFSQELFDIIGEFFSEEEGIPGWND